MGPLSPDSPQSKTPPAPQLQNRKIEKYVLTPGGVANDLPSTQQEQQGGNAATMMTSLLSGIARNIVSISSLTSVADLEQQLAGLNEASADLAAALVEASKPERSVRHVLDNSQGAMSG